MSGHASASLDPPVNLDYQLGLDSNAFFKVNISSICKRLKRQSCWHGSQDLLNNNPNGSKIIREEFLLPLFNNELACIDQCINFQQSLKTSSKSTCDKTMKSRHKLLVKKESVLLRHFVESTYDQFCSKDSNCFVQMQWKGLLWQIGDAVIRLIKIDMCCNSSQIYKCVSSTVNSAFASSMTDIVSIFHKNMQSTIYYIAGWHIRAALKASKKRKGEMKRVLEKLVENGTSTFEQVTDSDLPITKVSRSNQFGGLCYVHCI